MRAVVPGYSIAPAREEHLRALSEIERAAGELFAGYVPDTIPEVPTSLRMFAEGARDGHLWVALSGTTAVGFALVTLLAPRRPHIEELDVHPSHGRRGLGTALIHTVCEWATDRGYPEVTLTTFRDVPWNRPFYARLGFQEIPGDALGPELAAVVAEEAARGLDPALRVVMRYSCEASS